MPENFRKYNGVLRYTMPVADGQFGITAMGYEGRWTATDQIPQRAVDEGLIGRFGSLNDSDGGHSYRYSVSADYRTPLAGGTLQTTAYGIRYYLNLFSDFTYYLNNPVDGDQFNQLDNRKIFGWNGSWSRVDTLFGKQTQNTVGWDIRQDRIDPVGLYDTARRVRISTTLEDQVRETSYSVYFENQTQWTDMLRSIVGMRGESYNFDVTSNIPQNSGSRTAGMGLPKLSLIYGPWNKSEFFINAGESFHSNDARGVVATVDPKTLEPIGQATPLVRGKGAEAGVRTEIVPNLQSSMAFWYLILIRNSCSAATKAQPSRAGRPSASASNGRTNTFLCAGCCSISTSHGRVRVSRTTSRSATTFPTPCSRPRRQGLRSRIEDPGLQVFLAATSDRDT